MATDFESLLAAATARPNPTIPAVVLSAVSRTGKQVYAGTSGHMGLSESAPPITKDATFWLASCTKLPTSIAALQLVERGLVGLDDPVARWLPELENKPVVSLVASPSPDQQQQQQQGVRLHPARNPITLRLLLTHTSGLAYERTNAALTAWRAGAGPLPAGAERTVTQLYDLPLVFEPGEGWAYGPGIDWAGVLVERVVGGGVTLGAHLQAEIFGRLNAGRADGDGDVAVGRDTTFRLDSADAQAARIRERLLPNVERGADGALTQKPWGFSEDVVEDSGGAGWYSTVADYMAILVDLLADEPRLLRRDSVEEWLFKGHVAHKGALAQLLLSRTGMAPRADGETQESPVNYALGGLIWVQDGDVLPKGSLAWGGLPNLKWFANRERGLAAMYASQVTPPGDPQSQDLNAKFFQEVWRLYNAGEGAGSSRQ